MSALAQQITVRIDERQRELLLRVSEHGSMRVSDYVRKAIAYCLEKDIGYLEETQQWRGNARIGE